GLVKPVLDRLDHDLAGVHADADLQIGVADALDAVLHGERRETAADRVILMRLRCAEQRHHSVALRLVDDAVVADDGLVHELEDGLQTLHAEFGIAQAVHQAGRVTDVGKQYGQTLALPALGVKRLQNILPGRIGIRCDGLAQRRAAVPAEPARGSIDVAAGLACDRERRATAFAVLVGRPVLTTAALTLHW